MLKGSHEKLQSSHEATADGLVLVGACPALGPAFQMIGDVRAKALQFVVSDMWKPYVDVLKQQTGQALQILDRFHVVAKLNNAVDEVRAKEARELARQDYEPILKHTRWCFLTRREKQSLDQRWKLKDVLHYDLRTVRAFLLKESCDAFWTYS